jgi:fumarylacetoacetase
MAYHIDIPYDSPFTLHNIPFGVISTKDNDKPRCATALGDFAIDLAMYREDRSYTDSGQDLHHIFNQVCGCIDSVPQSEI